MRAYQSSLIDAIFSAKQATDPALQVYQNNYRENGLNALKIEFPTLEHLLGEENFRGMMMEYIKKYPKSDFNWSSFGQHVDDFLRSNDILEDMPFLLEVAQLDWHFRTIEKMPDVPFEPSSFQLMQTLPTDQLAFVAATGIRVITAFFPVDIFVQLPSLHGTDRYQILLENTKKAITTAIKTAQPRSFLLWRREFQPCIQALNDNQRLAYERLITGALVQEVLEVAGEDANQIGNWLQNAIQEQQICAVKIHAPK